MITKEACNRLKIELEALCEAANSSLDNLAFCEQQRAQIEALEKENDMLRKRLKEAGISNELF